MEMLGMLLKICMSDSSRRNISIKSFYNWMKPAVYHDQILLIKTRMIKEDNGYVTWAWVDDNTLDKYLTESRFTLHPSDWNEGPHLIIMDFCVNGPSYEAIRMLYDIRESLLSSGVHSINVCVRDELGEIIKVKRWESEKNA
ncbi:toxin-activating lysine-acyltransferase [Enterovibrio coralii]|nr:toxin-activating lysine-acyltransferase [Enterovibrio coralii]